jgi:16S rRNA pseudouridine516 synthase
VSLDGEALLMAAPLYWMLHKPAGVVSATCDSEHPTALDLLPLQSLNPRQRGALQIAGRLDLDTTGLLLITTDGAWNHRVTSPRKGVGKRYRVITASPIAPDTAAAFADGLLLKGERHRTQPARLEQLSACEALLEIHEGKYHQVKRMFAALGNRVEQLHREAIGRIELDPGLLPGQFRALGPAEIAAFD